MNDGAALLEAIRQHPDDDGARLAFADWCEEEGDQDRALFVRLQLARARLDPHDPARDKPTAREKALLAQHGAAWSGHPEPGLLLEFRRGLVEHARLPARSFTALAPGLVARHPVRSFALAGTDGWVTLAEQIAACPVLARVEHLTFVERPTGGAGLGNDGLRALLASPHLGALRSLVLARNDLTTVGVQDIAGSAGLPRLEELDLTYNALTATAIEPLARAARRSGLRRLGLADNPLGPAGARALAEGTLTGLTHLDLAHTQAQTGGVRALLYSPLAANLEYLRLGRLHLAIQAAELIARRAGLPRLRALDLNGNRLGDDGALELAASPALAGLRALRLRKNRLTIAGVRALAGSDHLRNLAVLDLGGNVADASEKARLREQFGRGFAVL